MKLASLPEQFGASRQILLHCRLRFTASHFLVCYPENIQSALRPRSYLDALHQAVHQEGVLREHLVQDLKVNVRSLNQDKSNTLAAQHQFCWQTQTRLCFVV